MARIVTAQLRLAGSRFASSTRLPRILRLMNGFNPRFEFLDEPMQRSSGEGDVAVWHVEGYRFVDV
jgi:hypothetical protein